MGVSILLLEPPPTDPPPEPQKPPKPTQNQLRSTRDPFLPPQSRCLRIFSPGGHPKRPSFDPSHATLKFGKVRNLPREKWPAGPPGHKSRNFFLAMNRLWEGHSEKIYALK